MQPAVHKEQSLAIIYDAGLISAPRVDYFSVDYWNSRRALIGEATGRGSAWFIDTSFGSVVLRQYLRGGWVAKFSRRSYFFTTVLRSRSFREFQLLATLYEQGLPVPRPVAALCEFHGVISTGAIMTVCISSAKTLADILPTYSDNPDLFDGLWENVGKCIRRFHDAGVWHADLNARNILLDPGLQVFLIDFDRARLTPAKSVDGKRNLKRLKRSLVKTWPTEKLFMMHTAWAQLTTGYHE